MIRSYYSLDNEAIDDSPAHHSMNTFCNWRARRITVIPCRNTPLKEQPSSIHLQRDDQSEFLTYDITDESRRVSA
ncbi:hypothetical protein FRC20_010136, partial [Serendipita sp. 405]